MDAVKWVSGSLRLMKDRPTRFVFLNDVHVPDSIELAPVFEFIGDFKPDHIILGGDILDMASFSHWERDRPRRAREMPYPADEYGLCRDRFFMPLRKAAPKAIITLMMGNHEARAEHSIDAFPEGRGFWEVERNVTGVDQFTKQYDTVALGKLWFAHGDILTCNSKVAAQRILDLYRRSIRIGHFHCLSETGYTSPVDIDDRHSARVCGTLQNFQPNFMRHRPHSWQHAFTHGIVEPNGKFWDWTSRINGGVFYAEGRRYK